MALPSLLQATRAAGLPGLLLVLLAAQTAYAPTADPDLWWHLRIGEQALQQGSRLPVEIFSAPFAGQPWPYKDLLADVLLWLIYNKGGGYYGFFLLKLVAGLSLGLSLVLALPRGRRHPLLVLLVSGLLLCALGLVERPNLFSLMLFPALLAMLERARRAAGEAAWRTQALSAGAPLLLVWLWAQLHRAAMVGFVLLILHAAYLAAAWLGARWTRRPDGLTPALLGVRPAPASVLAAAGAAVLAPLLGLLNPSGAALFRTSVGVARSAMLRTFITEWRPVDPELFLRSPGGAVTVVGALAMLFSLGRALRRRQAGPVSAWHLGLLLLFGGRLALDSVRWQPYVIDTSALVLALVLSEAWASAAAVLRARLGGRTPRGVALLLGVLLCGLQLVTRPDPLVLAESEVLQPRGAVAFARAEGLRGPVLNAYGLGGYLIYALWPEVRVVVDGRNDMIYPAAFIEQAIHAQRDPDAFTGLRRQAPATWVMAWNRPDHASHAFLARDPAWALVYWDDVATVYVQRAAHPRLAERAYRLIDPVALEAGVARLVARQQRDAAPGGAGGPGAEVVLRALEQELLRLVAAAPQSLRANGALLIFYSKMGPGFAQKRDAILRNLDAFAPDNPAISRLKQHLGL